MRKFFIAFSMMLSLSTFGQIKISDVKPKEIIGEIGLLGNFSAKLTLEETMCYLTYKDANFTKIANYKAFYFDVKDLDAIYSLFTDFSKVQKGDSKSVNLENGDELFFNYKKSFGLMYVEVDHVSKAGVSGRLMNLTGKQYKKLFGKE